MFSLFTVFSLGIKYGLSPPYTLDSENKVGYWEFGGSAVVFPDSICLIPPIQFKRGCTWTNLQIPKSEWRSTYNFTFTKGNEGTSFAVWFTDKYSAEGSLAGGPNTFRGIAIICSLKIDKKGNSFIDFHFLQNKGIIKYTMDTLGESIGEIPYNIGDVVTLELLMSSKEIEIKFNSKHLHTAALFVNLVDSYIGITASSEQSFAQLNLISVDFHIFTKEELKSNRNVFMSREDEYTKDQTESLQYRNPHFKEMLIERAYVEEKVMNRTASWDRVIELIDELNYVAYHVSSFSELNKFIRETIIPYTHKWQKRTLKVSDIIHSSKNAVSTAMNYTNSVIKTLNESITENSQKLSRKSKSLVDLFNEVEDDVDITEMVKNSGNSFSTALLIIGVAEFVTLVGILYFFSTSKGKSLINW